MSKDLTDVDAFSTPIHVPENTDSRNNAAGDVELIAQRLGNRTHYLNLRTAKLAGGNALAGTQAITGALGVSGLATVGGLAVSGSAAIPTVSGSMDVAVDLFAGDDVIAGNEFQYGSPLPTRHVILPLFDSFGEGVISIAGGTNHVLLVTAGQVHVWPIKLPEGSTLTKVQAVLNKTSTGTTTLRVYRKQGYDWTNPVAAMPNDFTFGPTVENVSGDRMVEVVMSQATVNDSVQCFAHITAGNNNERVYGIRIEFTDPGPRNH